MGYAEGLVKIEMTDISAVIAWTTQADLSIHIGAIKVHLPAMLMNDFAYGLDSSFEHTVSGRIRHHERSEVVGVLLSPGPQVIDIDVSPLVAADADDLHPSHHRTGWIGSVSRGRNETDIAMGFSPILMVCANDEKPAYSP